MIYTTIIIVSIIVIAMRIFMGPLDRMAGDRPTDKEDRKTITQAYYNNKVLLIKHKDYSFTEYHNDNGTWRKAPSMNKVTDQSLSSALTRSAASVTRGGVVKVLRGLY